MCPKAHVAEHGRCQTPYRIAMTESSVEQVTYFGSLAVSAGIGFAMMGHCFGMCGALASVVAR